MVQRVVNELTADEVHRTGGVKIGNFGTGGRTYSRYGRGFTPKEQRSNAVIIAAIFALIGMVCLYFSEQSLYRTIGCANEAMDNALEVDRARYDPSVNQELVFTTSSDIALEGEPIRDNYFGMPFTKKTGAVRRVTEYCQWTEVMHETKVKVGRDSSCRSDDTSDSCNIYRTDRSYTYYKGWVSHPINSAFFDNPAAYHNPQRDPVPSRSYTPNGLINLGGEAAIATQSNKFLRIAPLHIESSMSAWSAFPLFKETATDIPQQAYSDGFTEADHKFFYSRVPKDGMNHPLARAAFSYLVDGILDIEQISAGVGAESTLDKAGLGWITRGTCNAGDIRVHFDTKFIPTSISLAGRQLTGGTVVPNQCKSGGTMVLSQPGLMDLETMAKKTVADLRWWTNLYRTGIAVLLAIAGALFKDSFFGAVYCPGFAFLTMWVYFYGFQISLSVLALGALTGFALFGDTLAAKGAGGDNQQAQPKKTV